MDSGPVAFVDIDHTITRRSSVRRFIGAGVRTGALPLRNLLSLPFYYLQYRFGRMRTDLGSRGFPELEGMRREQLVRIAEIGFERRLKDDIFAEAVELIADLRAGRRTVVLATSSVELIVSPIARYLGIDHVLASSLEFADGRCTGRFLRPPLLGDEKRRAARAFARGRGVDLADCSFYSDSIYDLPLLEAVGSPVAVNPDPRLARIARSRGWRVLRFDRTRGSIK